MENASDVERSANWAIQDVTGFTLLNEDLDSVTVQDQLEAGKDTVWLSLARDHLAHGLIER